MMKKINNKRGFSIFIAVIIAGSLTVVAFTVSKIVTRSLEFANTGKNSQLAFFAADAGIECALFWDAQETSKFATSTSPSTVSCAGINMSGNGAVGSDTIPGTSTLTRIGGGGDANPTSSFGFDFNQGVNPLDACVITLVNKSYQPDPVTGELKLKTKISSFGYNTCDTNFSRRVERGLEVNY